MIDISFVTDTIYVICIDVKNITLQIKKKHKNMLFHFLKKSLKTCIKNIKLQYPSK